MTLSVARSCEGYVILVDLSDTEDDGWTQQSSERRRRSSEDSTAEQSDMRFVGHSL